MPSPPQHVANLAGHASCPSWEAGGESWSVAPVSGEGSRGGGHREAKAG
eukprot:CAMPEP_0204564218 /NCGR_PEP_ID=MMETSP0661-20131031/34762_1 /ASSEMBLY_ACC=CAM_ASM_000606 /TAXON_ID=109239 /ORGANISM="Alexandrium margalefi, Strain AMGDE01CS-322" /LENGTH=48 /DNA_ID= /DNA_START= /DNA_END= /DNA_ORIENTATION=